MTLNNEFIEYITGLTIRDYVIIGGYETETSNSDSRIVIGIELKEYCSYHNDLQTTVLYKKLIEDNLDKIEQANNEELETITDELNIMVAEVVVDHDFVHYFNAYLNGAYDFFTNVWSKANNIKLPDNSIRVIIPDFQESEYFIYEDLALIRVGLDSRIDNYYENKDEEPEDSVWDEDYYDTAGDWAEAPLPDLNNIVEEHKNFGEESF